MTAWNAVKAELTRLLDEQPDALTSYPDPRSDRDRIPPFRIHLAAWATDVAEHLHGQFGDDVRLQVGAQPYPPEPAEPAAIPPDARPPAPDIAFELVGQLTVRSGHRVTHRIRITNNGDTTIGFGSNGQLIADITRPRTGRVVGGYTGAQTLKLVSFALEPGQTREIPLLVGTASFDPALGYAIPPGAWTIRVTLALWDGRTVTTPDLPIIITP
jgi:hypothetical protein